MTDAEQQKLFARLEKLERSNWRWKALASVLGVVLLLLLSLAAVSAVAIRAEATRQLLQAVDAEQRARQAAEEAAAQRRLADEQRRAAEAEARRLNGQGATKGQAP
jgi:hypothetical protein